MKKRWQSLVFALIASIVASPAMALERVPVTLGGWQFHLEVANTPESRAEGLMNRDGLPTHGGMVFVFEEPAPVGFWMKNCRISLDMLFLRDGVVRRIQHQAPPCTQDPCPIYRSIEPVDRVIELPAGTAQLLGIRPGSRIALPALKAFKPAE